MQKIKKGEIEFKQKPFIKEWLTDPKIRVFEKNVFKTFSLD